MHSRHSRQISSCVAFVVCFPQISLLECIHRRNFKRCRNPNTQVSVFAPCLNNSCWIADCDPNLKAALEIFCLLFPYLHCCSSDYPLLHYGPSSRHVLLACHSKQNAENEWESKRTNKVKPCRAESKRTSGVKPCCAQAKRTCGEKPCKAESIPEQPTLDHLRGQRNDYSQGRAT